MARPRPRRRRPPDASLPDITPLEPVHEVAPPRDEMRTVRLVPRPDPVEDEAQPVGRLVTGAPAPAAHPRQLSIDDARLAKRRAERDYRSIRQDLEKATAATQRAGRRLVAAEERVEKLRRELLTAEERAREAGKDVDSLRADAAEVADELKRVYETLEAARRRVRELESPRAT
jgi:predicted transposase YdaD